MAEKNLDSIGVTIMLVVAFLLPIFFIPLKAVPFEESKAALLGAGVLISFILYLVGRLRGNEVAAPLSVYGLALIILPFSALLSAVFSGNFFHSLVGQGFATDTMLSISVLSIAFLSGAFLFSVRRRIIHLYLALFVSALVLFIYQTLRLLGVDFLSFDLLFGNTANLLGKWNDLAIFFGLIIILSTITLDALRPHGLLRNLCYLSIATSLAMLTIVNFSLVWDVLAVIFAILFIRSFVEGKFSQRQKGSIEEEDEEIVSLSPEKKKVSGLISVMLAIFLLFSVSGNIVENYVSGWFNISQVEVRPSITSTFSIMKSVYSERALFGIGPNNFTKEWLLNKPQSVNETPFWNLDFSFGVGIIPTFFITHGVLNVFLWLVFFGFFIWGGIRALSRRKEQSLNAYLATSSFFSAAFLWVLSFVYIPNLVLIFFAYLFTGIFLAMEVQIGTVKQKVITFSNNTKQGFVAIVILFALFVASVAALYITATKYTALAYTQYATTRANKDGDLEKALERISKAMLFNKSDTLYRIQSNTAVARLFEVVRLENSLEVQQEFQRTLSLAIDGGQQAVTVDGKNYQNWVALGRVYESVVPLKLSGAYENARAAYERAISLNPRSPYLRLLLARTEVQNGNNEAARSYISDALRLKRDYTDAIFLLSQIEIQEGKVKEAISSIETASVLEPGNSLVYFQLGLLKYSQEDYGGAIEAFSRATTLNPQYANARYFLGLAYYNRGRISDSIAQFEVVGELNPDNQEVATIIENLTAGRAPFENFTPPPSDPLKADSLPVEE